jgi:magnesium-transporting ATPase (P-type)
MAHLAVCHSILVDEKTGKYNASSPDELALVNAAKFFGVEFKKLDEENNMIVDFKGQQRSYRLLNILEFNSTRKRMSVIVESHEKTHDGFNEIYILTKGADSIILPRLAPSAQNIEVTRNFVDLYAQEGLRTLLLGQRKITNSEYQ